MARALGSRAQFAAKFESTYGTAPSGNWSKLPFVSTDLGAEQPLDEAPELGKGRDPVEPVRGARDAGGQVIVPVDLRDFGFWLKALFGDPVTSEGSTGQYVHTFQSGSFSLPSFAAEIGHPGIPAYHVNTGQAANSMALEFARAGAAQATIEVIGQDEAAPAGSTSAGTVTERTFARFNQFQGSIKKDSVALANVTGASVQYSNNLDPVPRIDPTGTIAGVDPGVASLTGSLEVRYADTSLITVAENNDAIELEFAYVIDGDRQLVWTVHEVRLPKAKQSIAGPAGVTATYDWRGNKDAAEGVMTTVELHNDIASY